MKLSFFSKILGVALVALLAYFGFFAASDQQALDQENLSIQSRQGSKTSNSQEKKSDTVRGLLDKENTEDSLEENPEKDLEKIVLEESIQALSDLQQQVAQEIEDQQTIDQNNNSNSRKNIANKKKVADDFISFTDDDLAELNLKNKIDDNASDSRGSDKESNRGSGSGIIPGVRRQVNNSATGESKVSEEIATTAAAFSDLPDVKGQARGFNMLYLMHPRARETVERQVAALEVSGLRNLYLSVLTDGTFAEDFKYLNSIIQRLNKVSDSLTLILYMTNGPTMRDFSSPISVAFNKIDPTRFRDLIQFNQSVRDEYKGMVAKVKTVFEFNKSLRLSNKNIAIVMLEDNLTNAAYQSMRDLSKEVLGSDLVEYYRNPCEGCFPGNEGDPMGDKLEVHSTNDLLKITRGDAFTNDGQTYRLSGEIGNQATLSDIEQGMLTAQKKGSSYFGLWREERQGLQTGQPRVHPDQRVYEVPTTEQLIAEVSMLRNGLVEVIK